MPSQPMGDRKPSQLWDEICTLSRLPEIDDNSQQHKEVDLKKEIWLQSLPSCARVLLHNTDEKSMVDLSTMADEILMSQNAAHRSTVSTAVEQQQQHPEVYTDDVMSAQRFGKHTECSQFRAMIEPDGICTYHKKFGSSARSCVHGCKWTSKKLQKRSFLGRTAANALHPHPLEADSATHPSQAGFFIKDELSDYRFLVDTGAFDPFSHHYETTPPFTLLHPNSSQPMVHPSARMVNRRSVSVSLVGHTLGPSSLLTCATYYSVLTSYHTSAW